MPLHPKSRSLASVWDAVRPLPFLLAAAGIFLRPRAAMEGVAQGLDTCVHAIIPAMFPFLVLSGILLASPLAAWAGLALRPYTRLLGIRSPKAPAALLCGLLGGFAAGARAVGALRAQGELTAPEARCLLVCAACAGPAFVVGSVGTALLGSSATGWLLYLCQTAAGLVCAFAFRPRGKAGPAAGAPAAAPARCAPGESLSRAVADGVQATALLCGYVVLFAFLAAVATPAQAPAGARYAILVGLEITGACRAACAVPWAGKIYLCAAAVSLLGASVFVQVKAFAGPQVSLRSLALSRLLHLPLMLAFVAAALRLFPGAVAASAPAGGWTLARRMPADALCAVFVLCALVFGGRAPGRLHWRKNRV